MLPDLSPSHILIFLIAALVFIGPDRLPGFLRKVGQFVGKMRGMANEFRASFDEMARQSELDDLRKEVEAMRQASHAALPQDLGIAAAMQSDAEAAYLANWEASHAAPTDVAPATEPTILPPPATAVADAPKKPRASRAKPPVDAGTPPNPPAKPRAPRKPKPEAEV